jgi:hypothetical protein
VVRTVSDLRALDLDVVALLLLGAEERGETMTAPSPPAAFGAPR